MTTPKRSPGAHDICIHPNDMHRHTCHSQTSEIDIQPMQLREEIRGLYRYACADSCEYTVFLLVCTHVGDKHMWQSKQSCHWWDCNAQGACASMPMLAPRARNYLLTAASRMGHWQGQNPPTTRRAQPSEQLRHAAMLSLQKRGTARKPKMC